MSQENPSANTEPNTATSSLNRFQELESQHALQILAELSAVIKGMDAENFTPSQAAPLTLNHGDMKTAGAIFEISMLRIPRVGDLLSRDWVFLSNGQIYTCDTFPLSPDVLDISTLKSPEPNEAISDQVRIIKTLFKKPTADPAQQSLDEPFFLIETPEADAPQNLIEASAVEDESAGALTNSTPTKEETHIDASDVFPAESAKTSSIDEATTSSMIQPVPAPDSPAPTRGPDSEKARSRVPQKHAFPKTIEEWNDISREERVLRATFEIEEGHLRFTQAGHAVTAAYLDILPSRDSEDSSTVFLKSRREYDDIIKRLVNNAFFVERNPGKASEDAKRMQENLIAYLKEQGYPADITSLEIRDIAYRQDTFQELLRTRRPRAAAPPAPAPEKTTQKTPTPSEPTQPKPGEVGKTQKNGNGYNPVKGKSFVAPFPQPLQATSEFNNSATALSERDSRNRAMGRAILALNHDKSPIYPTLSSVAENVFASELRGLSGAARNSRIKNLVDQEIVPYIQSCARSLAQARNPSPGQQETAKHIGALLSESGYHSLSASEVAMIMSRQVTLKTLLERKNTANSQPVQSPIPSSTPIGSGSEPRPDTTSPQPNGSSAENHAGRKDKLTDAQRRYLDVVFDEDPRTGELRHDSVDEALQALYPKEYVESLANPTRQHNVGQLKGHFSRVGKVVVRMLKDMEKGDSTPAELRSFIHKLKEKPAFKDLPEDILISYAGRLLPNN